MSVSPKPDPDMIRDAVRVLYGELHIDNVAELRSLASPWDSFKDVVGPCGGWFSDADSFVRCAVELNADRGGNTVFCTLNAIDPDLLARCMNRLRKKHAPTTADKDVLRRRWLVVDCDVVRLSQVSATDDEKAAAFERGRDVAAWLKSQGWPEPVEADSGNGYHALYRIDEPAEDGGLVERCLKALNQRFGDDVVKIDSTVASTARIMKVYGSIAMKGDDHPRRPHRLSKILVEPKPGEPFGGAEVVPFDLLEALAAEVVEPATRAGLAREAAADPELEAFLERNGLGYSRKPKVLVLDECPFCGEADGRAVVGRAAGLGSDSGAYFKCQGNRCSTAGNRWHELTAKLGDNLAGNDPNGARPNVYITTRIKQDADAAEAALAETGSVYHRGGLLVRVVHRDDTWLTEPLPAASLTEQLSAAATWLRHDGKTAKKAKPPQDVVKALHQRGQWESLPGLRMVAAVPTLRPDGTLIQTAGYDSASGVLLQVDCDFPEVPEQPSREDAERARARLLDVLHDFPFVADCDRQAALAAILTLVSDLLHSGARPMFVVRAPTPGTGKDLLVWLILTIGLGKPPAPVAPLNDKSEERKRLLSHCMEGRKAVWINNVEQPLGSDVLAGALTSRTYSDRVLGVSRTGTGEVPVHFASGNNVMVKGDLARRIVPIDLDANVERPEERTGFRYANLRRHVLDHQPELLAAALTLLRWFVVSGRPQPDMKTYGSFEEWSAVVRACLVSLGGADPITGRSRMEDSDPRVESHQQFLECVFAVFESDEVTARDLVRAARMHQQGDADADRAARDDLKAAICELHRELTPYRIEQGDGASRLGYVLKQMVGRVYAGRKLVRVGKGRGGALYRIDEVGA